MEALLQNQRAVADETVTQVHVGGGGPEGVGIDQIMDKNST